MRQIGTLARYHDALRFGDYLRARGKAVRLVEQPDGLAVWVFDDDVPWATTELEAFKEDPSHPRFPPPRDSPEYLLAGLPPLERQIVELHRQGYPIGQIAARLLVYERKVRRVLNRFEALLERQRELPWA